MKREIIKIDENICDGCGLCIPNCQEGALQIIDGKVVSVSDLLCDGLGACINHCPLGALTIEKREAKPYDEIIVMKDMVKKGKNVVIAHLMHLKNHSEIIYLKQGRDFLISNKNLLQFDCQEVLDIIDDKCYNDKSDIKPTSHSNHHSEGCPGARSMSFSGSENIDNEKLNIASELTHWPIQLHLIQPSASYFNKCDLLVSADCTAFCYGAFHQNFLKGRKVVIACPKLDVNKEIYIEKIKKLIDESHVNTITVMIMEVPCCGGLLQMVQMAVQKANKKVPLKGITISIKGEILEETWI